MLVPQPLAIDFTQEDSVLKVYPRSALLSSKQAAWQGIHLGYYHQPAHETPEYHSEQHTISINLGQSVTLEQRRSNGFCITEHQVYGDVGIYPASFSFQEHWNREVEFVELYLEPTFFNRAAYDLIDLDRVEIVPYPTIHDPLIQHIGLALKAALESALIHDPNRGSHVDSRLYAESMATALIAHLLKHYSTQKPKIQEHERGLPLSKLREAIAYIQAHLDRDLGLVEIATVVHMSSHYFASLFKQSTGQTPHQYVTSCRIEKAKQLLAKNNLAISDICQQVGFQDQSHFTKVFRRYTNVTPKVYRSKF